MIRIYRDSCCMVLLSLPPLFSEKRFSRHDEVGMESSATSNFSADTVMYSISYLELFVYIYER